MRVLSRRSTGQRVCDTASRAAGNPVAHAVATLFVLFGVLLGTPVNAADCSATSTGNAPLYPSIFVPRTAGEEAAGLAAANSITSGSRVLLSIGMSNAKGIWDKFKDDAEEDPLKHPNLQVVNGAQPGGATSSWAEQGLQKTWGELDESLANAGVTKNNIYIIWFVTHNAVGSQSLDAYSTALESNARDALDLFAIEFPNLKVVWLQPMIYAGYSTTSGNSEPYAHESGAVVQRLLVNQNWPFFVGYGPYLWADGVVARDDGLTWLCSDFKDDGNHPDVGAKVKHSDGLLQFFHEDSVASIGYLSAGALLTVPNVVGLDQATAEATVTSASFVVGAVSTANSDTVQAGNVISQSPTGGSMAAAGTAVSLVVSLGPAQMTAVPDVVGLAQAAAENSITTAGLTVGTVSTAFSDTVLAGNIVSQSPAGGSMVPSGTAVDLVVSLGPPQLTTVPDVVGLTQAAAETSIAAAGLVTGTVSAVNSDTVAAGNVISQNPAGGSSVTSGTAVDLVVSLGSVTGVPTMISPTPGSTLPGSSETFTWSAQGASVSNWQLLVGTTAGTRDIFGARLTSAVTSQLVTTLPTDGSTVFVRLRWTINGVTSQADYTYTASGGGEPPPPTGTPAITSPVPGSVLSGATETFTWSAGSAAVSRWRLEIGTTPDGTDLFVQNLAASTTSMVVSGLPTNGNPVYVNLKWRVGNVTSVASYVYTASGGGP